MVLKFGERKESHRLTLYTIQSTPPLVAYTNYVLDELGRCIIGGNTYKPKLIWDIIITG